MYFSKGKSSLLESDNLESNFHPFSKLETSSHARALDQATAGVKLSILTSACTAVSSCFIRASKLANRHLSNFR
jgi:hypothetical protein